VLPVEVLCRSQDFSYCREVRVMFWRRKERECILGAKNTLLFIWSPGIQATGHHRPYKIPNSMDTSTESFGSMAFVKYRGSDLCTELAVPTVFWLALLEHTSFDQVSPSQLLWVLCLRQCKHCSITRTKTLLRTIGT
jgi:hypothetical protein